MPPAKKQPAKKSVKKPKGAKGAGKRKKKRKEREKEVDRLLKGEKHDWKTIDEPARLAERARRLGMDDDARALLQKDPDAEAVNRVFEKIIDANNLLGVRFLFEGTRKARAVCRIRVPVPGGTRLGTGSLERRNHKLRVEHRNKVRDVGYGLVRD